MTDRGYGVWLTDSVLPWTLVAATLMIGGRELSALPLVKELAPATPYLAVQGTGAGPGPQDDPSSSAPSSSEDGAPLAALTKALAAASAKLEQLNRASEALAGAAALRAELSAKDAELAARDQENRRLTAELETLRARAAEWQRADDAAKAQITGLGQALDEATAEAKKLDGELAAVRWQNAQLGTSLSRARTEQEAAKAETEKVRTELSAQIDDLATSAEASASRLGRLKEELAERGQLLASASRAQEQSTRRVAELQQAVDDADRELSRVRGQLTVTANRLNEVNLALSAAEQERDTAQGELATARADSDRLSDRLTVVEADLGRARAANGRLETRLAGLEQAATVATDAARQNLLAVENQIAALNATLAEVDLAPRTPARPGTGEAAPIRPGDRAAAVAGGAASEPSPAADADGADRDAVRPVLTPIPAVAPAAGPSGGPAAGPAAAPAPGELALVRLAGPAASADPPTLAALTAELPVESRIQAQSLLADLKAETDRQGVKLIVPGAELFSVNGQEVRDTAHDSLAKVAELINLYKRQPVLIIGHTDALGAPDYNKTLSERRADLVRQFFIDHFDVEAARLSTEGMGEQQPIASNATAAGRRANRRVEVVILN